MPEGLAVALVEPRGRPRFLVGDAVALDVEEAFCCLPGPLLGEDAALMLVPGGRPGGFAGVALGLVVLMLSLGGRPRPRLTGATAFLCAMLMEK
jgi:hypothetical protein